MCGIAGAVNHGTSGITVSTLRKMAMGIERRGPHAYGVAWIDADNRIRMHKWCGPISKNLDIFDAMQKPRAVIMHTRWSTHGDPSANENNHPHPCDGGWIVHNGQIPNHGELVDEYGLLPSSECDSEVLGMLIPEFKGTLLERVTKTVNLCDHTRPLNMAGIWGGPNRLVVVKRGNPLFCGVGTSGNLYFSSCTAGLPGDVIDLEDNVVFTHFLDRKPNVVHGEVMPFVDTGVKVTGSSTFSKEEYDSETDQMTDEEVQELFDENIWSDEDEEALQDMPDLRAESIRLLTQQSGDRGIIENLRSKQTP